MPTARFGGPFCFAVTAAHSASCPGLTRAHEALPRTQPHGSSRGLDEQIFGGNEQTVRADEMYPERANVAQTRNVREP